MFVARQLNTGEVVFSDFMVKFRCLADSTLSEVWLLSLLELLDEFSVSELLDEFSVSELLDELSVSELLDDLVLSDLLYDPAPTLDLSLLPSGTHTSNNVLD